MLPSVTIQKNVFSIVGAPPSQVGIEAILAASSTGTQLQPGAFARTDLAITSYGYGPLTEYAAQIISTANNPVVLAKGNATYPGSYNGFSTSVTGSSVVTTTGTPFDHYAVIVNITQGGTVGTAGITYTYSTDNGNTTSGVQALGTATSLAIPNTGVSFGLAAGSLGTGDSWKTFTERPLLNDTDVVNGINALFLTRAPWEGVLIDSSMTTSTVGLLDTLFSAQEGKGQFKFYVLNTRYKVEPLPTAESEAAYLASLTTLVQNQVSIRGCVGADGGHIASPITGWNIKRPTSMFLMARAALIPIGEDPAYVARGPVGAQLSDSNGNPFDHDEDLYPNLDGIRLVSLRSFAAAGPQGVYITNANTMQPTGGTFPYLQMIRIANLACTIAWSILSTQLSRGVGKNPKADPVTGAVYILETSASAIENLVNDAYVQPFKGQVNQIQFSLSRTDNLNAIPAIVTGLISIVLLAYIKGFQIQQQYNKTIQVAN